MTNANIEVVSIPISETWTTVYQRQRVNKKRVAYLVTNWDWRVYTPINVCERKNEVGKYFVIDGQHRITAAKYLGLTGLPAMISETSGLVEEAKLFRAINGAGGSLRTNQYDDWNAAVVAGDANIKAINDIIERHEFKVAWQTGDNTITAVAAVKRLVKKYGLYIFDLTLEIIRAGCNGASAALQGNFLRGMAHFLHTYHDDEIFRRERFVEKLRTTSCENILRDLNRKRTANGYGLVANETFADIYNPGLRGDKKLVVKG